MQVYNYIGVTHPSIDLSAYIFVGYVLCQDTGKHHWRIVQFVWDGIPVAWVMVPVEPEMM